MLLRSLLFVPGNRDNMLDKAVSFRPDAFIPDMEDSVPQGEKAHARQTIRQYLPSLKATGVPLFPRVNALETGLAEADLDAVVGPLISGISIGKIYSEDDIHQVCEIVSRLERENGLADGQIKLIPWIETAKSIVNCYSICSASPRVIAAAFGPEDLTHDLGIERTAEQTEVMYARSAMIIAAHAAGIQVLDAPFFSFKDQLALTENVLELKRIGFTGKFAIHPDQIQPIDTAFRPSDEQVAHARRVIEVFEQAERKGQGSTSLDGKVVDVPVVKRARAVLRMLQVEKQDC